MSVETKIFLKCSLKSAKLHLKKLYKATSPLASFSLPQISLHLHGSAQFCSHLSHPWINEHGILFTMPSPAPY